MGSEERQLAWGMGFVIAIIVVALVILVGAVRWMVGSWLIAAGIVTVLIVAAGFIPFGNGYSVWGWIRLGLTTDWRH